MGAGPVDEDEEITSINVTPLVDITLVLLIIFMVTTSVITQQEGLEIAKPEAATGKKLDVASVLLVCRNDGTVLVDGKTTASDAEITEAIVDKLVDDENLQGIVQCDKEAQVGTMVHLIDLLREAGVKKYAIATQKPAPSVGG
jgi:biopolymer transport protein ExbD